MITDTRERIAEFIRVNGRARVNDLVEHLGLGNVAIHRQLKRLVESEVLAKMGTPPKVFYLPAEKQEKPERKKTGEAENKKHKLCNGHISSYEIQQLFDWLLTEEDKRKAAVFTWTSGLARQIGYIIEKYYKQTKKPGYPKYDEIFTTKPFMCFNCLKKRI